MAAPAGSVRAAESRILRRTRLKLVAWSAGSTLLVLLGMGALLYVATARILAADAEKLLRTRADTMVLSGQPVVAAAGGERGALPVAGRPSAMVPGSDVRFRVSVVSDPGTAGLVVGGPASGTIAITVPEPLPASAAGARFETFDAVGYEAALGGLMVINERALMGAPMRVLSLPVTDAPAPFVIQVAADRTAELRMLEGLAVILGVAGAAAVAVAAAFGWLYAGRALVPVRESLRRQRELAADASHELRTPLAVIRGNLELLRGRGRPTTAGDPGDPDPGPDPLDEIDAEVGRLSGLVDQLLLLARADSDALEVERRQADLGAEAADALDALTAVAAARDVILVLDVEPVPLQGDPARLRQLATILIDNAIRHAPGGGRVEVAAHARLGHALLSVTDDGPGIRPEDLPHVFDRFWRAADAPAGGSGLGLAIAAWIAEQHDGTIRAEARATGGARFLVDLPAT